jgi:CHAT domain-containing protein
MNSDAIARPVTRSLAWRVTVAVVVLVAATLTLFHRIQNDPLKDLGIAPRVFEARLTSFKYATLRIPRSANVRTSASESIALAELAAAVQRQRSAENLHRLGTANLAVGKARDGNLLLAEALQASPRDAAVLADLAAASIMLGRIADAAELAASALDIDAHHEAATFNWALALEKLNNTPAAIEAWEKYVQLDPNSGWGTEARRHIGRLRAPRASYEVDRQLLRGGTDRATIERLVRRYPQRSRARAHNVLLPEWVETGRAEELVALQMIGETRAALGDSYILDIAKHAASPTTGQTNPRDTLRPGVSAYNAARASEKASRWDDAAAQFSSAAQLLRVAGSPLAIGAEIYAASSELSGGRSEAALARLELIEKELAPVETRYPSMVAETAWIRGLLMARRGQSDAALDAYRVAQNAARRAGEIEHEIAIAELVASRMASVADPEEADRLRLDVLQRLDDIGAEPQRRYTAYQEMAFTSLRANRPHVALAFASVASRMADDAHDMAGLALSASRRALALDRIGKRAASRMAIADARSHAATIPSEGARDRALAEIDYTTGLLEVRDHPDRAAHAYMSALAIWDRYGWRNHIAAGHLALGDATLAAGDRTRAEKHFRTGISTMEADRVRISEPLLRIAFFERSDPLFDRLIALLLKEGRDEEALSILERKRARFLLDQIAATQGTATPPLNAAEIVSRIGENTAILQIALLEHSVELWLISNGRIAHHGFEITREVFEGAVARHVAAILAHDEAAVRRSGRWLFDKTVAPFSSYLATAQTLVVVGDGPLQSFPFATLFTPDARYLVDLFAVQSAPSASVFLRSPSRGESETLLAVAQASPLGFAPLPEADREASVIARMYAHARFASGKAITPKQFVQSAASAGVVHFSGHSVADEERPYRASLIFEADDTARHLTAETIGRARLRTQPLVVLAACSTARGKARRNEGVDSIAAAFLQAGARGVVATIWDIDDEASGRLFRMFHEHLRSRPPSQALRMTQRTFLHSDNAVDRDPLYWASVTLISSN